MLFSENLSWKHLLCHLKQKFLPKSQRLDSDFHILNLLNTHFVFETIIQIFHLLRECISNVHWSFSLLLIFFGYVKANILVKIYWNSFHYFWKYLILNLSFYFYNIPFATASYFKTILFKIVEGINILSHLLTLKMVFNNILLLIEIFSQVE